MRGWLPGCLFVWAVDGSGPAGVLALAEGWVTVLSCTVVRGGWLPGVFGVGNTPAVVGCCGLVVVVVCWWWVPPRALVRVGVACCRGSGAVRPGCLTRVLLPCLWVVGCGCGWVGCELYSGREHLTVRFLRQSVSCFVRVSLLFVFLSVRWMPWHQGPMKDVVACDIPRGAGWRAVIRGFPNGGTRHELCRVTCI